MEIFLFETREGDLTCLCRIFGHFLVRVHREKTPPKRQELKLKHGNTDTDNDG